MHETVRLVCCGDRSLMVYLGASIDPAVNDRVHALTRLLRAKQHPAITEITPSYHCLLVEYDPVRIRPDQLEELVMTAAVSAAGSQAEGRPVAIPVRYGGEYGPDLPTVAAHSGLSEAEVVRQHAAGSYRVYCLGFSPGFPYLGGLTERLHTPRLAEPRTHVPAGSVAIGGAQTGVYPAASPGGWQLIGRTPIRLFDPYRTPPALLEPGDSIRFEAIDDVQYADFEAREALRAPGALKPEGGGGATGLRIIQPGMATTVQDLGRRGYQQYGVPVAGAADFAALMVGNWLLGNRARTSGLEITLMGPEVEFSGPTAFSLTGAPIPAELTPAGGGSPVPVPMWSTQLASPGDRLRLGTATAGCRSYLCLAGGIDLPPVLGSLSEDLFGKIGPLGRPLKAGDWLPLGLPLHPPADLAGRALPPDLIPAYGGLVTVRAVRGPQIDAFTPEAMEQFFRGEYVVGAKSDRQGLRLEGSPIAHRTTADILSEPIAAGSVQVPANGQPILLLGNRQTVGGYTKVAVAVYPDLSAASQVRPGDRIRFQEVDAAEAHAIAWAERRKLAQVRRHLERAISSAPETGARIASVPVPAVAPQLQPEALQTEAPVNAPSGVRTYRISILGIEYETTVEEVPD